MIPDLSALAETVFKSYPEDVATLNRWCDQTEADRAAFGEDDLRVQAGESKVNNLKGLFTRRIAWACFQHDARFGLRKKTTGAIAKRPTDGLTHATDVLLWHDDGQVIDVMSDRNVSWGITPGDTQPLNDWIKPLPPEGEPIPAPVPVPEPAPEDNDLAARVTKLEAWIEADKSILQTMEDSITRGLQRCGSLELRVKDLEQRPVSTPPPFDLPPLVAVGKVFGFTVKLPVQKA